MAEVQNYAPMFAPITGQNPLQGANQMMDLQTKGLQNQAALQEFKARQAIGPILQSAIDPQTGTLDANKAFVGMASHPDAAWKAQDFLKSATEMNLTNANIAKTHLETAMERQGQIAQSASSLLGSLKPGQELTGPQLLAEGKRMLAQGQIEPKDYEQFTQQVMNTQEGPRMTALGKQIALTSSKALDTMKTVFPAPQFHDVGPFIQPTQTNPITGNISAGPQINKGMSPEQLNTQVPTVDSRGQTNLVPRGAQPMVGPPAGFQAPGGTMAPTAGQGVGAGNPPGSPSQTQPTGNPSTPPAPNPSNPPATAPMPVKSLAPQVQEQWKKMGADYDKVQERLQNAMSLMQPIAEAEKALEHYTPTAGGEVRLMAAKVASGLGAPEALVRQIANGELASAQVFQSTMLDLATSRMRAALQGGGRFTNIEFQAFRDAKPNPNMTKEAVQELFAHYKRGIMLDQAYVEGYNHFADKGTSPTEFNNWLINLQNSYQKKMKENLK